MAAFIRRIEIDWLWSGRMHVEWELDRHVNILSGVNGVGKSTILNRVARYLRAQKLMEPAEHGITLSYDDPEASLVRFDVIRSFDSPILSGELLSKLSDVHLRSELDVRLYQLQRHYLDYQVSLSNRMLAFFTNGMPDAQERAAQVAQEKMHFFDVVDQLFRQTHKKIMRDCNEICFQQHGETVYPYQLSSGEKQMLIILLTVLLQNRQPFVLLMDEPEVSLHIEWQQALVGLVLDLNPQTQIILTTHSPAVIMDGWADHVTNVEDIVSDCIRKNQN